MEEEQLPPYIEKFRWPGSETVIQVTTSSHAPSLNDVDRQCTAILAQHKSDAPEQNSALETRVEGIYQWILSNQLSSDWDVQQNSSLLLISGDSSNSKPILSACLLEYLSDGESSPSLRGDNTSPCHSFSDEMIETRRDGTAVLQSLIHQLVCRRQQVIKYLEAAYDLQGPNFYQNFNEMWKIFIAIASNKRNGPINVIIDAIDECEKDTRDRLLHSMLKLVNESQSTGVTRLPRMKFVITSHPQLSRLYPPHIELMIDPSQGRVEDDLKLVIQARIARIVSRTHCKPEARVYLEKALYSKADRTFLWATLVLHLLEKSYFTSQKDFECIVDELPQDLPATYERFLQRIPSENQRHASKMLYFIMGSSRPMTLDEMGVLIALSGQSSLQAVKTDMQPNIQETIEEILGPLVRIWKSRIYLVHLSLKEFLLGIAEEPAYPLSSSFGIDSAKSNLLIAESCIRYLLLDDFSYDLFLVEDASSEISPTTPSDDSDDTLGLEDLWDPFHIGENGREDMFIDPVILEAEACTRIEKRYPLFDYAATHWAEHFALGCKSASPELKAAARRLSDARDFPGLNWFRYFWSRSNNNMSYPMDFGPIVTASFFGHHDTVGSLLENSAFLDTYMSQDRGLSWAARKGHTTIVQKLLDKGANPDVKVADGSTCLIAASQYDRGEVVCLLLDREGRLPNGAGFRVNFTWNRGRTPLSIASENGFLGIVRQLLDHEHVLPDIPDLDQWTPLFYSVFGKHLDVLQTLLSDRDVSPNHLDRTGRNAISWAASEGHIDIVKYLLSLSHMRVEERDLVGRNALSWAAGNGQLEVIIELRRSRRFDISSRDNDGRNALSWASHGRHYKVVEYLIKCDRLGADAADADGWTPLAWALFGNAPKTVQVLLSSGAVDVNKRDRNGRTALSFAAGYGYLEVVKLLLGVAGIDVRNTSDTGQTPLSAAQANGQFEVANTLLKALGE
ncbi:uncharacterized protein RSE6_01393 [Rhynchosporium secalis]|uniref:Nephrocystin 3-like N-terminal domain-containing protein n=1 Tax=Rhynchosporium secalis TaxID=38038 RepID=A0A1E1LXP4_RHYSE|nr:uncharacterized protein RSE6_01393 [Rhynchosporium secalis]